MNSPIPPSATSAIAAHIETAAYLAPGELQHDEALFSAGLIDSMNLLELIAFVEKTFQIRVPAEDITLDHWDSVEKINAYLIRRSGS